MRIVAIRLKRPDPRIIREAARVLHEGGVVMYPTETAYGLAADIRQLGAVKRIFRIKGRTKEKTLPLIVGNVSMVGRYAVWNARATQLAKRHWPGPLTLVLRSKKNARKFFKQQTIALRVPDLMLARQLSLKLGHPITSTSANISGKKTCYSVAAFFKQMKGKNILPDLILDAGRLRGRKPSTIVDTISVPPVVLRKGPIRLSTFS